LLVELQSAGTVKLERAVLVSMSTQVEPTTEPASHVRALAVGAYQKNGIAKARTVNARISGRMFILRY
jgi:hypothetical protein